MDLLAGTACKYNRSWTGTGRCELRVGKHLLSGKLTDIVPSSHPTDELRRRSTRSNEVIHSIAKKLDNAKMYINSHKAALRYRSGNASMVSHLPILRKNRTYQAVLQNKG